MEENTQRLAIIGCGFMGSAILQGLLLHQSPTQEPPLKLHYTAHVNSSTSLNRLQQTFSSHSSSITFTQGTPQLLQAVSTADIILLAFLPADLDKILETNNLASHLRGKTIISILAGISTSKLLSALHSHSSPGTSSSPTDFSSSITRVIPTLSANISSSVTLLAGDPPLSPSSSSSIVEKLFRRIGSVHYIPENLMDTATAIGAAMHALAIVAVDSATDASVAEGLPRSIAQSLTAACLQSCTSLMLPSTSSSSSSSSSSGGIKGGGMTPESVKAAMSTPAGITINSILDLERNVRQGIAGTVRNAVEYTKRMNE